MRPPVALFVTQSSQSAGIPSEYFIRSPEPGYTRTHRTRVFDEAPAARGAHEHEARRDGLCTTRKDLVNEELISFIEG